jgi:hypothetical protein
MVPPHISHLFKFKQFDLIVYSIGSLLFKEGNPQVMVESIWTLSDNFDKKNQRMGQRTNACSLPIFS